MSPLLRTIAVVLGLSLGACLSGEVSSTRTLPPDGGFGIDGGPRADGGARPPDGGRDAGEPTDAGVYSGTDAGTDAGFDGGTDAGADAGPGGCVPEAVASCSCNGPGLGTVRCLANGSGWGSCSCATYGAELYVAPTGDDSAAGTMAAPFLTLERAQTAVRALLGKGPLPGGVVVWLRGGIYPRTSSFALTSGDSGDAGAPVVYRGYPGETARLVGGVDIAPSAFQPVTASSPVWSRLDPSAQGQLVSVDLGSLGLTDFGTLSPRGFTAMGVPAALELFIDGQRAPLGRWPDADQTDANALPDPNGSQVTVYGTGVLPDVTGLYVQSSVQDGVSAFARQGLVDGGLQYNLYRAQGSNAQSPWLSWFLTTSSSGYPAAGDPFFFNYQAELTGMSGAQGGQGTPTFVNPTAVINGFESIASVTPPSTFAFATNRTARWTSAPDAWVHGYFAYPWADQHLPITGLNVGSGAITATGTIFDGISATVQGGGASVAYVYNLLEEMTEPGEWYLDRASGLLYLWPPANLATHDFVVSVLAAPLVTVTGAVDVTLQELTLEASRTSLIEIEGSSSNVQVVGCVLRDSGDAAAAITNGTQNVFDGDLIHDTGEDGVEISAGDRLSLTPGGNVVQGCDIHDFSQWVSCYTPAVSLSGDGNTVQHNVIHDAPHAAILFDTSSQQLIQFNEIYRVVAFSSDSGAIYAWNDWGSYGNVIQYNFIHDLSSGLGGYGIHAIYLDGCLSGPSVLGNVLYDVQGDAIFHNGGHDVTIANNVIVGCDAALITEGACANGSVTCSDAGTTQLLQQLEALDYQQSPWSSSYPACAAIPDDCATLTATGAPWLTPFGSSFTDNVSYDNGTLYLDDKAATLQAYVAFGNNLDGQDPLFVDEATLNFNLQPNSPAYALPGFVAIPFDEIGIQP